ncbi:hypothetical protein P4S72_16595 [Vibrio sp. PP-XX7]
MLSVTGRNDIAEDATKTGEMIGDVAFQLGATDLSKALYNIKDPTIAKALKGNVESALDAMIDAGVDPAIAKQLLTTPELYKAVSDVLYAYDQAKSVTEGGDDDSKPDHIPGQPLKLFITDGGYNAEQKVLIGLNDAKNYIDTLPTEQAQAALLAMQMLTGGVVKTAVGFVKDLAVDTVFGKYLSQVKHDVGEHIAARANRESVLTHEEMLDYEKENGTEDGLWGETQNGAEFALEVLGVGAGMALSGKGSHSSENDANIKTEGTGTVLADGVANNKVAGTNQELLNELASNGIKYTSEKVISVSKGADDRIYFLEEGNSRAGLQHIIESHGDDFARRGVSEEQIPELVMTAVTKGKIVGYQGKDTGRPIYEVTFNGQTHKVAVTTGNNGFIVGANPAR